MELREGIRERSAEKNVWKNLSTKTRTNIASKTPVHKQLFDRKEGSDGLAGGAGGHPFHQHTPAQDECHKCAAWASGAPARRIEHNYIIRERALCAQMRTPHCTRGYYYARGGERTRS